MYGLELEPGVKDDQVVVDTEVKKTLTLLLISPGPRGPMTDLH